MKQPFKAIVAVSQNGVIGKNGDLPWRLAEDLKWFKKITMGHVVLMGRKTWDSLPFPCLLYTSPSPRDVEESRMPSSA